MEYHHAKARRLMASQPRKAAFLAATGGFKTVIARVADGETITDIAAQHGMSCSWLSGQLGKPKWREAYHAAKRQRAEVFGDKARRVIEEAPVDSREGLRKAELL